MEVKSAELTNEGLRFDRSFILVAPPEDNTGELPLVEHLTIKKVFELALFQPEIDETWTKLTVKYTAATNHHSSITIPLIPSPFALLTSKSYRVSVFGTSAIGVDAGPEAASFFSCHLGRSVLLLFIGGSGCRDIPGAAYVPNQVNALSLALAEGLQLQRIRFADAAPLLVTSSASELNAKARLMPDSREEDIILRLRPNIHVDVQGLVPAWDEDNWSTLIVDTGRNSQQEVTIKCIFRTVRCLSLNADPESGAMAPRNRQLYGLLAKDRRVNTKFPRESAFRT